MSEMIERVARILEPQAWRALGTGDTLAYSHRRTSSLRKARAAIEVMRIPTGNMCMAANDGWPDPPFNTTCSELARGLYQTMIDAALQD